MKTIIKPNFWSSWREKLHTNAHGNSTPQKGDFMMTIGELLTQLKQCKPEAKVYFDFGRCAPTLIASSRGDYARPALGWSWTGRGRGLGPPNVAELIAELEKAIDGRAYTGWKGGNYTYSLGSLLCVDNPGLWTETELIRAQDLDYKVILHTHCVESS